MSAEALSSLQAFLHSVPAKDAALLRRILKQREESLLTTFRDLSRGLSTVSNLYSELQGLSDQG